MFIVLVFLLLLSFLLQELAVRLGSQLADAASKKRLLDLERQQKEEELDAWRQQREEEERRSKSSQEDKRQELMERAYLKQKQLDDMIRDKWSSDASGKRKAAVADAKGEVAGVPVDGAESVGENDPEVENEAPVVKKARAGVSVSDELFGADSDSDEDK